jgi:molecular chaperone GrpE (heat shock protein)
MTKPREPHPPEDQATKARIDDLEKALADALARSAAAESQLADQQQRLKALGSGREESMRALAATRDELRRTSIERDELRKHLARIDSVQTATLALPEDDEAIPVSPSTTLPSLDEMMTALGEIPEPGTRVAGHLHQRVQHEKDPDDSEEMIAPALVFPEQFAATAQPAGEAADAPATRLLVLLDPERPVKYPLFKEIMTIGRADAADIQIDNDFLSRLHARLVSTPEGVTIEDYESKNGIRVNAKPTERQLLRHGDTVDLGRLRFRFIDAASDDET